jgi:lipoprotein-releasing system ATP-binding protein
MSEVNESSVLPMNSTEAAEVVLSVKDLQKKFHLPNGGELTVLDGVSIDVHSGEFLVIHGKSGIGKSTFLHILGLLDHADSGQIMFGNENLEVASRRRRAAFRAQKIGFVFQFYHLLPEFTALENILLAGQIARSPMQWLREKASYRERAFELLNLMGISDRAQHTPNQLSGGERQRVALARAMFNEPDILLCDEPTGNLDVKTSDAIHQLLSDVNQKTGQTMVIVTHDVSLQPEGCRVVDLVDGCFEDPNAVASELSED